MPKPEYITKVVPKPIPRTKAKYIPNNNIIDFEPDELNYTTSNNLFQNIMQEPTHQYPTRLTQPTKQPDIIPNIPPQPPNSIQQSGRLLTPRTYSI